MTSYALGLDYGSDSVRALLVDALTGAEVATNVVYYPRWKKGLFCVPAKDQFRQHPLDYLESLTAVVQGLWATAPAGAASKIVGVSFDTTGSTPVAVDKDGVALALKPEFADNPNAMFVLWKDHTAIREAQEITAAANQASTNYLKYEGGIYSSEWYWAKALHVLRADEAVRKAAWYWVEHADWMSAVLTDTTHPEKLRMGRCATGHKVMWHESWNGYPPNAFFTSIDPLLDGLRDRLPAETFTSDQSAGALTAEWAEKLGLPVGIPVGFSAFDCHMGAVAANVKEGVLTKIMGTSTCDITVASYEAIGDKCIRGICGQVDGSVMPGLIGLEAGQSAFGDLYAWFRNLVNWPVQNLLQTSTLLDDNTREQLIRELEDKTLAALGNAASKLAPGATGITALDWVNGRRTPDADQTVSMAITGLKMGSHAPEIFRALVEATAFGARAIIERFKEEGVAIDSVVVIGGISKKSDFVMQVCADVWNCKIDVLESEQSCALGAAIFAATIGGVYPDVASAQKVMASPVSKSYLPNADAAVVYDRLYQNYLALGAYVNGDAK
ncbi:ribulokinase [Cellvibrio polysaccharolyticus]|uniref:Ribulokinase n=1 Tax=Cellvibrio polysaccharolyticus TaxID=2082724 RepID=A0A928V3Y1_9GAMM|nr:ribulokinase [Cellvibrio polysaccharolyticus]MBE8716184.1 ribulokinase [Cellvibrio polysaccharolyticus]